MLKIAVIAVLALSAAPAVAGDGAWKIGNDQVHLIDSTIDTRTVAGRARLLSRVERIADRMCETLNGNTRRDCVVDTIGNSMKVRGGQALALAVRERDAVAVAAR